MSYVSHADLGGATDRGPIESEPEGIVFHHGWEAKALALTLAAGASGRWNIDMSRRYRETLPDYADLTYFEIWTASLERLLVDRGLVTEDELAAGHAIHAPAEVRGVLAADRVAAALARGGPVEREPSGPARFAVGDRVRTRSGTVDHHTRLPSYVAGRVGTIARVHGVHVFPDTNAHDLGEQPQWLYNVVFDARECWEDATPGQRVSVDAWEPYLEPVS
ncbi:MAG: nitrile hydratase subunit beta [Ilumatobacter sp.]|uniref:nitrile hydratase subunit beta n=1 Tax=Ilumatobacter sp. TaxID=1967498 RepID=UPI0026134835|nr:nitrile hydratase subunit beta [Ilumatobacter sp.]MDJ0768045.1 nitrile hydratase subunit beta [Ilumatobacter sp.]